MTVTADSGTTAPAIPTQTAATPARRTSRRIRPQALVCTGCTLVYAAIGWYLALVHHVVEGDALARVENAAAILWSRTPHLGAIGFVWPPLPSLLDLPMVALARFWPAVTAYGLPGITESAAATGAAVILVHRTCRLLGAGRRTALLLTVSFAVNPLVVYFAANGMTEAWLISLTAAASLRLARWTTSGSTRDLALAGIWIALAYLCRYEALGAGALFAAVVAVRTYRNGAGTVATRLARARATTLVACFPLALAFLGWALLSWLITGDAFEQFGSVYGNTSIINVSDVASTGATFADRAVFSWHRTLELAPTLPVLLLLGLISRRMYRTAHLLGPLAVAGGALLCIYSVMLTGLSFQWLRYHILVIPLSIMFCAHAASPAPDRARPTRATTARAFVSRPPHAQRRIRTALVLAGPAIAVLTSWQSMLSPNGWAPTALSRALHGPDPNSSYAQSRRIAADLKNLDTPDGSVLVSMAAETFETVAVSDRPRVFVIPSDLDYGAALQDPCPRIHYLLTMPDYPLDPVAGRAMELRVHQPGTLSHVKGYGVGRSGGPYFDLWKTECPR